MKIYSKTKWNDLASKAIARITGSKQKDPFEPFNQLTKEEEFWNLTFTRPGIELYAKVMEEMENYERNMDRLYDEIEEEIPLDTPMIAIAFVCSYIATNICDDGQNIYLTSEFRTLMLHFQEQLGGSYDSTKIDELANLIRAKMHGYENGIVLPVLYQLTVSYLINFFGGVEE